MMKKILAAIFFLLFSAILFAGNVNIMTYKGGLVFGEIIGSDENALYLKVSNGSAKTIPLADIKKIFDNDTKQDITSQYKTVSSAVEQKAAVKGKESSIPENKGSEEAEHLKKAGQTAAPEETNHNEYETVVDESGMIDLREGSGIFVRTAPKYFGFGIDLFRINLLYSSNNVKLKQILKPYAVNAGGYTYDDGTLAISSGYTAYVYLRPIDCFALGGFYDIAPMNQNFSVYRGSENFMFVDMPTTDYGLLLRIIPFSQAVINADGVAEETLSMGINLKFGQETLGTFFGGASIADSASGTFSNLTGNGSYFAIEYFVGSAQDVMQFAIGYQTSLIDTITGDTKMDINPGIPAGILKAPDGSNLTFSCQSLYMNFTLAF